MSWIKRELTPSIIIEALWRIEADSQYGLYPDYVAILTGGFPCECGGYVAHAHDFGVCLACGDGYQFIEEKAPENDKA